jgi:hypothetical protein
MKVYSNYVRWMLIFLLFMFILALGFSIAFYVNKLYGFAIFMSLITLFVFLYLFKIVIITDESIYLIQVFHIKKLMWNQINAIGINKLLTLNPNGYVGSEIILKSVSPEDLMFKNNNSSELKIGYKHKVLLAIMERINISLKSYVLLDKREWIKLCNSCRKIKDIQFDFEFINYKYLNKQFRLNTNDIKYAVIAYDTKRRLLKHNIIILSTENHYQSNDIYCLEYSNEFVCVPYKRKYIKKLKNKGIEFYERNDCIL